MEKFYRLLTTLFLFFWVIQAHAQITISGLVTEEASGEGLAGVNVVIKGTSTGTITNIDGSYNLQVPDNNTILVFSYVGFLSKESSVGSASQLDVAMEADVFNLEEVVVTGLASSIKRSNLANAVSTVSAKELTGSTSIQTLDGGLQGKFAGANIVSNSGAPGGGFSIKLRGNSTINGSSEPLYIVDGIYMDNTAFSAGTNPVSATRTNGEITDEQDNPSNRMADLNPDDIESIEILKGASAASIYGTRANAGVIIITTKKGQNGKTRINLRQDIGFARILNPLGTRDFTDDIVRDTFGDDEVARFQAARSAGNLVDYEDEIYGETALLSNTSVSASGGNDKTSFFFSASNKDEDGIIKTTGYKKQSVRLNLDHKLSNIFDFSVNTNYIHSKASRSITNNDNAGVSLGIALTSTVPWDDLFPVDGVYPNNPKAASNPLQTRDLAEVLEETDRILIGGTMNVNIISTEDTFLKAVFQGGLDNYVNKTEAYFPENLQFMIGNQNGFFSRGNNTVLNTNVSAALVFSKSLASVALNSQVGVARLSFDQERLTTQATQLIGAQKNLEQASAISTFNRKLTSEDIGYFFQQEANFQDKIIATAGVRFDKSSLNGDPDKLYGYPKASVAANLHNLVDIGALDQLKLRVAYGESGGVPNADRNDLALPSQTIFNGTNISNDQSTAGSIIGIRRGNPDIKPERSREFETGFDVGFLNKRILLEATYYNKTIDDLVLLADPAQSTGFGEFVVNGGKLNNQGYELGLTASVLNNANVSWNSKLIWWRNRSEMKSLDIPAFTAGSFASGLGIFKIEEGRPVTQIVGPTPESAGADVVIGNAEPDFQTSWYNEVTFMRNFTFSMLWHWKKGGDNIQLTSLLTDFGGTSFDYDDDDDGDGVVNGDQRIAALVGDIPDASQFVVQSSYLKLREIAIYYNIPKSSLNSMFGETVESVRVGFSANNVWLISDYNSYDPEVSNFGSDGISTGVEVTPFPTSRRMFFHLSVGF